LFFLQIFPIIICICSTSPSASIYNCFFNFINNNKLWFLFYNFPNHCIILYLFFICKSIYSNTYIKSKLSRFYISHIINLLKKNTIIFVLQTGLKKYLKYKYNIEIFRCPDEAYIIEYNNGEKIIKILEKKEQNVSGSVETKLWACPSLKREYELVLGNEFVVDYCLCVNLYLQNLLLSNNKKYVILNKILYENKINILFGDADNYFETLDGLYSV
jgi:hypothetical protein